MADHPLRPATDRRLGEPLPHQLANRTRAPLGTAAFKNRPPFLAGTEGPASLCGISSGFPKLFPFPRQVTHVLLTRSPLYSRPEGHFRARLACIRHAASVHSEPGSNSPVESCMRSVPWHRHEAQRRYSGIGRLRKRVPEGYRRRRAETASRPIPAPARFVLSLSDVISDGRRGRRESTRTLPLFSFQRTGVCWPRAPKGRAASDAARCDLPASRRGLLSAFR